MPYFPFVLKTDIYIKKSLSSKVNACSLGPCRSTWAWGHKVWWKRELGWSAHGQEHLWHFILLWKWCNVALTLLSPEKMNQAQTEPQCSICFFEPIKVPVYWGCRVDLDDIHGNRTDWWKHIKNTVNTHLNALTGLKWSQLRLHDSLVCG